MSREWHFIPDETVGSGGYLLPVDAVDGIMEYVDQPFFLDHLLSLPHVPLTRRQRLAQRLRSARWRAARPFQALANAVRGYEYHDDD